MHALLERVRERLQATGYRDLRPSPAHVLLSLRHDRSRSAIPMKLPRCASATLS
jgi:hypothetical protein